MQDPFDIPGPEASSTGSATAAPQASGTEGRGSDGSGPQAGSTGEAGLPRFDVGDARPPDAAGGAPCRDLDVLFVIDDSSSMNDEQVQLAAGFPMFAAGLAALMDAGHDLHVGVVTTDDYAFNEPGCTSIGALTTQTGGANSSNATCAPFAAGRFLSAQDDLETDFACTARVGTSGNPKERPMEAMLRALDPGMQVQGQCNAGFRRPDALLAVVLLTDEDDLGDSPGSPDTWHDDLVSLAGGEDQVVVLALVGHPKPNACPTYQWNGSDGAQIASQILAFVELFGERGIVGDICAPDFEPFFEEALAVVEDACEALPAG